MDSIHSIHLKDSKLDINSLSIEELKETINDLYKDNIFLINYLTKIYEDRNKLIKSSKFDIETKTISICNSDENDNTLFFSINTYKELVLLKKDYNFIYDNFKNTSINIFEFIIEISKYIDIKDSSIDKLKSLLIEIQNNICSVTAEDNFKFFDNIKNIIKKQKILTDNKILSLKELNTQLLEKIKIERSEYVKLELKIESKNEELLKLKDICILLEEELLLLKNENFKLKNDKDLNIIENYNYKKINTNLTHELVRKNIIIESLTQNINTKKKLIKFIELKFKKKIYDITKEYNLVLKSLTNANADLNLNLCNIFNELFSKIEENEKLNIELDKIKNNIISKID